MKKALLLSMGIFSLGYAQAQNPAQKTKALITQFTETWCGPCGDWGHPMASDIILGLDNGNKGYLFTSRGSSSPSSLNSMGDASLGNNYAVTGVPSFYLLTTQDFGSSASALSAVNAFNSATTVVSAAANFKYTGTTLEVGAKAKFWSATSDEYYMTVFVVESKITGSQNTSGGYQSMTLAPLLRGAMSTTGTTLSSSPWGEKITLGATAANTTVYKVYTVNLDPSWVKNNLKYYVALYKKSGSVYEIVNIEEAKAGTIGTPTSMQSIAGLENASLYPNPVTEGDARLTISLKQAATLNVNVTDVNGRVVYVSNGIHFNAGNNNVTIPTQNLSNGVYTVNLIGDGKSSYAQQLVITK